jgi:thymidylate synthase (FAD)
MKDEFHVPKPEHIGIQSESSKQARDLGGPVTDVQRIASMDIADACRAAYARYQNLLGLGVPRELARLVLPVSTYSHMFATVDLHNLMHFLTLRLHKHAQYEIRVYAAAILDLVLRVVPVTMGYFIEGLMAKDGYDWWFDPNRNSQNANT